MDFLSAEALLGLAVVATLLVWALAPLRGVRRASHVGPQPSVGRERLAVVIPLPVSTRDTPRHAA